MGQKLLQSIIQVKTLQEGSILQELSWMIQIMFTFSVFSPKLEMTKNGTIGAE